MQLLLDWAYTTLVKEMDDKQRKELDSTLDRILNGNVDESKLERMALIRAQQHHK